MTSPTPTPTPTAGPTGSASPTPTPTPSPSPGPTPLPPGSASQMAQNIALPNVPANTYQLLSAVADAIDTTNGSLGKSSGKLNDIQSKTNGAVQNVSTTSQGRTTDALTTTWSNTQTDFNSAHSPLSSITTGGYMGGSPNPLRAALDAHKNDIQLGLIAMENIHTLQSACLLHPPSAQQVIEWADQVNALTGALGNISLVIDTIAVAIRGLNGGFSAACATGFVPGMPHPVFTQHAFASQSTGDGGGGGSGKSTITAEDLASSVQDHGGTGDEAAFIPILAEEQGLSLDSIQKLLDTGVNPEQIYKWLEGGTVTQAGVDDTTRLTSLLAQRGGDATQVASWTQGLDADQMATLEARAAQNPKLSSADLMDLTDPTLKYETNPKHLVKRPGVGPEPVNGQRALNNSVSYKPTTLSRVGIDPVTGDIVVLDDTNDGTFHGHVETWSQLDQDQQNALVNGGFINKPGGRIILRDSRGNIIGLGRKVSK